jgi:leucyl-tRNA synthetase
MTVPAGTNDRELEASALASEKVRAALKGAKPTKVIVVPGRLVSIVTR